MKVGYIGLGVMGGPMALNIASASFDLVVNDIDRDKAEPQIEAGAVWAATPREVAEAADIILTSVPGPPQVAAVANGEDGLLAGLGDGKIWADMTTNRPAFVRELGDRVAAKGAVMLDAPVTGAVDGARRGELTIFVGGASGALARCQPIFDVMGKTVASGKLGDGNVVKLITNQLWFTHARILGEGLALGAKAGVDVLVLWEAIKASVGDSFVAHHDAPSIFAGHYDPSFSIALCLKDLGLTTELAREVGVPVALTEKVEELFGDAETTYGGDAPELTVVKLVEEAAGVSLRADGDWVPHWEK
ncbi:MAG: NAD(P)-dependent oxidoreductase [Pseudomonadota bacterium]